MTPSVALAAALLAAGAPALPPPAVGPGAPRPDAAVLVERARALGLARDTGWLRLGHWRRGAFGWRSEARTPGFFLAPGGAEDPARELEATIEGMFAAAVPEPEGEEPIEPERMHAQCRFPARLAYLVQKLELDPQSLPRQECVRLGAFWRRVAARSVTLVFSSYYLNNPSSAFGHTFLRLNKADPGAGGDRYELLDQGADYAAQVDTTNPVAYAIRGLAGLFPGRFSARPYFYKVREYADYESRDLWEYDLRLEPGEVAMLVAHLWELGGTEFRYWYLTANCSYQVLALLETAAPRLDLTAQLRWITVPADTVRAVAASPGLVERVRWRPSIQTQFAARTRDMPDRELDQVAALADDPATALPSGWSAAEGALVLDAALDLVDLRYAKQIVNETDPGALRLRQTLLERRGATGVIAAPLDAPPPPSGGPDAGHPSRRLGLAAGGGRGEPAFLVAEYRAALHDLADPPAGFSPRTQLEFGRVRLRFTPERPSLRLDEAWLLELASLNAIDRFDHRPSWRLRVGGETILDAGCDRCVAGKLEGGAGVSHVALGDAVVALGTVDAEVAAAPGLKGTGGSAARLGLGPTGTLRLASSSRFALLANASWRWLPSAAPAATYAWSVQGRAHLRSGSIALEWRRAPLANEALVWWRAFL